MKQEVDSLCVLVFLKVWSNESISWSNESISSIDQTKADLLAIEEAKKPFDLASGPLLRITLLRLGEEKHVLLVTMHQIVFDAGSVGVFSRELFNECIH